MNDTGPNGMPPNKSLEIPFETSELAMDEIKIKQEPVVEHELQDENHVVLVSVNVSSGNSIGDEQLDDECLNMIEVKPDIDAKEEVKNCPANGEPGSSLQHNSNRSLSNKMPEEPKSRSINRKTDSRKGKSIVKLTITSSKKKSLEKVKHKCPTCEYVTSNESNMKGHIRLHMGEKPFPCSHCSKQFIQKVHLQSHMRTHVAAFLFSCSNCLQGFDEGSEMLSHQFNCTVRRFECDLCKKFSTFNKSLLGNHMRIHTGEKPFSCDHCLKSFTIKTNLKRHMKTHTNPHPQKLKCSFCYRIFDQQLEKDKHEGTYQRRGYECYLCKVFTSSKRRSVQRHIKIHVGEKPFQCELCQKRFVRKGNLKSHLKKIHKKY